MSNIVNLYLFVFVMKKIVLLASVISMMFLSGCAIINSGASLSSQAPIGSKVGETESYIFLGLISTKGQENNLKKAAEQGGIQNVSQVEYEDNLMLGGLIIKHTTRVYGE